MTKIKIEVAGEDSGVCLACSAPVRKGEKLCLGCCGKQAPHGPPLKRCRKFGFRVTYHQRQAMNIARDITGAIPTEVDADSCGVKMSRLFVAVDGNTYVSHEWIEQGGGGFSWSEPYGAETGVQAD